MTLFDASLISSDGNVPLSLMTKKDNLEYDLTSQAEFSKTGKIPGTTENKGS